MTDNPYTSPSVDTQLGTSDPRSTSLSTIAKSTFLAWERLRIVFLVLLGLLTLLISWPGITEIRTLFRIAEGAIVANIGYFAGPIGETYVRWLGYDRIWVRWFLFVGGTTLTALLAFFTMASMLLPNQL